MGSSFKGYFNQGGIQDKIDEHQNEEEDHDENKEALRRQQ